METLGELGERQVLARILPILHRPAPQVVVGPGDDAALLEMPSGRVVVSTDAMVRGVDWRDDWSTGRDVGIKCITQNVADIAAMGAASTAVLVTLAADLATRIDWVEQFSVGIEAAARHYGVAVVGGDLSDAAAGTVLVSVTALGQAAGPVVQRGGARSGDVVAVHGSLGRAAAGLRLLQLDQRELPGASELLRAQQAPWMDATAGPVAAAAGAHAMIDISDGLLRDAGAVAAASAVRVDLDSSALATDIDRLTRTVGREAALAAVLSGGEEHSLLACFPPTAELPAGWRVIGRVVARPAVPGLQVGGQRLDGPVTLDGAPVTPRGWEHFAPN